MSLRNFISEYLQMFQFAAVCMTMAVAGKTMVTWVSVPQEILVIHEFHYDKQLPSGQIPARFLITKNRDDCAPTTLTYYFEDSLGWRHRLEWTGAPAPTGEKTWTKYNLKFAIGSTARPGKGTIYGNIIYGGACGDKRYEFEPREYEVVQNWWKP